MGLFRSGNRHDDEDPDDAPGQEEAMFPGRSSLTPNRKPPTRRSSGLSRNGSARSVSCSAKTIKCGTGQRTFGGNGYTMDTGVTNSTRSVRMHQSVGRFRAIYQNNDNNNLDTSQQSVVSELDVESCPPIGEALHENEESKRVSGLGPQHDHNLHDTELVSADFTFASGSIHNCNHSRYSTANSKRSQNSKTSLPSLEKSVDSVADASVELFDQLTVVSSSVMIDKEKAENLGRSGTFFVYVVLLVAGIFFSAGSYTLARWSQTRRFELEFKSFARETADLAETVADQLFSQLETMSTTVTSEGMLEREWIHNHDHFHDHFEEFAAWPNVTIPHFDERIEDLSTSFGSIMLLYVPLVQSKDRDSWEQYANELAPWKLPTRSRNDSLDYAPIETSVSLVNTDHSFADDDHDHDHDHDDSNRRRRKTEKIELSRGMSEDFKSIHPYIHDDIDDICPGCEDVDTFLSSILENQGGIEDPLGISAPIYQYGRPGHQRTEDSSIALMDLWTHPVFKQEVIASIEYNVPVISEYLDLGFLDPGGYSSSLRDSRDGNMENDNDTNSDKKLSQLSLSGVRSLVLHAVKENFERGAKTIGFVVAVVPWSTYFRNVLKSSKRKARDVNGIVVKVVSHCGSKFTFVLNSKDEPTEVHLGDWREQYEQYEDLEYASQIFHIDHPHGRSHHCHFDLHIYPNQEFEANYRNNSPWYYAMVVGGIFVFTAIIFAFYDSFIFKGQRHIVNEATGMIVENARRAAKNERDLNDFIAHEVRNPLAAAISACSFVSSALIDDRKGSLNDNVRRNSNGMDDEAEKTALIASDEKRKEVLDDVNIIDSSLHFINDLLRNMLDMQRAGSNQIHIEKKPTDIMNDVLKPVEAMMHLRDVSFKIILECNNGLQDFADDDDEQLFVMTDPIRLKQVMLNLARNSTKFVRKGFIRCSANVNPINGFVELRVDDSGPGIPPEKRSQVFEKFQQSLDTLQQGTGIGLSLCKRMVDLMGGSLFIDEDYRSGIEGCPGTRFVIQLKIPPLHLNKMIFEPRVSAIDGAGLGRSHMLDDTEFPEKPSSITSMEDLTNSGHSSISSTFKENLDADVNENESDPRLPEPVANVTESLDSVTKKLEVQKNSGSIMLPLPSALRQKAKDVILNDCPDPIDVSGRSTKVTELPKNYSVLFVDDDMVLRKLFSRVLKKINPTWNCKEASSGEAAIELLTSNAESNRGLENGQDSKQEECDCGFDLIFMDQYMASVQKQLLGTETVRVIRAKGFSKPIICGLSANDVEDAFYRAGSDAFMFKPFPCKKDELEKELLKVINSGVRHR